MRKILYSPGYGAGWSTWNGGEVAKYMLEYQPIIEFLEGGGKFDYSECGGMGDEKKIHPLLAQLRNACKEKFGADYVCVLGASDLEVKTVASRVRINEYDGSEEVEEEGEYEGWM